jgi:hypothetical protein
VKQTTTAIMTIEESEFGATEEIKTAWRIKV